MTQVNHLLDGYWSWLRDRTALREVDGWVEITTPFLDRHNDYLQVYLREENGRLVLTDDAHTIQDLRYSGCDLRSKRRQDILHTTLRGFGVDLEDDALIVRATPDNFALKKHGLLQAMLAVNDLFYLASANVMSLFWEDVAEWLNESDIRFVPRVKFAGRSGYDHVFDFVIPSSRSAPERIIQAVSRPTRERAVSIAFAWSDTRDTRNPDSRAYAMLNDAEHAPPAEVLEALRAYEVRPVPWSERERVRAELAA
jgi:hypothetical protein